MTEQLTGRKGPPGERPAVAASGPSTGNPAPTPRDLAARSPHRDGGRATADAPHAAGPTASGPASNGAASPAPASPAPASPAPAGPAPAVTAPAEPPRVAA